MIHRLVRAGAEICSRAAPRLRKTPRRIPALRAYDSDRAGGVSPLGTANLRGAAGRPATAPTWWVARWRDLLLGIVPKDFGRGHRRHAPRQVKSHFRRAHHHRAPVSGLVHVMFGGRNDRGVSTFPRLRRRRERDTDGGMARVLADNVFGEQYEDAAAARLHDQTRCTTTRAAAEVLDYTDGVARHPPAPACGSSAIRRPRYREDPVRMLRAVRFAAKTRIRD